ncbi:DUF4239 domain-containing protein [Ciceribacter sp. RN22]|uniref:bestrophin-like domain n=1 Tax=Ciceribacter sp. RN22 TaxID=2954932 RepID=UPI00209232E1|nr:DUF4239 domain-containing protein [Ciceribacter sp. RN22]MCO6180915.1 DUF4239 domain-containing protein [Ciceribacter sp. RN22]
MSWQAYDHYLYALIALIGTLGGALLLLWVLRAKRWAAHTRSFSGLVPPFINILGVLFGLTLAFLANDTWSARDRAIAAVSREADAIESIAILADHLPASYGITIKDAERAYVRAMIEEWPLLAARSTSAAAAGSGDHLLSLLSDPVVVAQAGTVISGQQITMAMVLRDSRSTRIALSQTHVNPLKWAGMAILGFLTMVSTAFAHLDRPRAMILAVGIFGLAAAPMAVIVLIHGNPFQAPAAVSAAPLHEALWRLQQN